jgi:hypothetical protein
MTLMRLDHGIFTLVLFFTSSLEIRPADYVLNSPTDTSIRPVEEIVAKMVAQSQWQDQALREYETLRRFHASNLRFSVDSRLVVLTTFHQPDTHESKVIEQEGSKFIRERVFDKILEAEKETKSKKVKAQIDILPENYDFKLLGMDDVQGRKCYHLTISPKRKSKYLLNGSIWVDAENYGIARIQGSPSKRPSLWALKTEVDRRYKPIGDFWLTDRIDSISDLLMAGHSTLSIEYSYENVQPERSLD